MLIAEVVVSGIWWWYPASLLYLKSIFSALLLCEKNNYAKILSCRTSSFVDLVVIPTEFFWNPSLVWVYVAQMVTI